MLIFIQTGIIATWFGASDSTTKLDSFVSLNRSDSDSIHGMFNFLAPDTRLARREGYIEFIEDSK